MVRLGHFDRDEAIIAAMTLGINLPVPMFSDPQDEGNVTLRPEGTGQNQESGAPKTRPRRTTT